MLCKTPASLTNGGRIIPATSKKRGTMTPRAGITIPALSVAPGPVRKRSWGGRAISHQAKMLRLTPKHPCEGIAPQLTGQAVLGSDPRVSIQLDPKLLPGIIASQAGDSRRVSPLAFTLSPPAAS